MSTTRRNILLLTAFFALWAAVFYWASTCLVDQYYGCSMCMDDPYCRGGVPNWWMALGENQADSNSLFSPARGLTNYGVDTRYLAVALAAAAVPAVCVAGIFGLAMLVIHGWKKSRLWVLPALATTLLVSGLVWGMEGTIGRGWLLGGQPGRLDEQIGILGGAGLLIFFSAVGAYFSRAKLERWLEQRRQNNSLLQDHDWAHESPQGWDQAASEKK